MGVPERWLAFFGKFLKPRARYRGRTGPPRRGLLLEHALADVFAECVLWLLDLHVYRTTGTQLLRMVDDIWFLADAPDGALAVWREVEAFCRACGLAVNESKSGAVRLGGPTGATQTKPVGLVYVGLAWAGGVRSQSYNWAGTRHEVQSRTAKQALNLLRRHLLTQ